MHEEDFHLSDRVRSQAHWHGRPARVVYTKSVMAGTAMPRLTRDANRRCTPINADGTGEHPRSSALIGGFNLSTAPLTTMLSYET